jgi:hypothetical protein
MNYCCFNLLPRASLFNVLQADVEASIRSRMSSINEAAYHGDLALVQDYIVVEPDCVLSTAISPKTGLRMEMTPLRAAICGSAQVGAVASSHAAIVALLIESKANLANLHSCLEEAVKSPSGPIMAALLRAQGSKMDRGDYLTDLLLKAVGHGHIDPIKVLLAHKADPNRDQQYKNCLEVALNFYPEHLSRDIVAALIEAKADVQKCRHCNLPLVPLQR